MAEVSIDLTSRPEGSESKIRPFRDGFRILGTILALLRDYKPLTFFGSLAIALVALGMIPGCLVIVEYLSTGLVPRLPSAVLAVGFVLTGMMLLVVGLILHSMTRRIRELEYQLRRMTASGRAGDERGALQVQARFAAERTLPVNRERRGASASAG